MNQGDIWEQQMLLDVIGSTPDDDGAWLVYADWLEERGSPLAEAIRKSLDRPWALLFQLVAQLSDDDRRHLLSTVVQ